MSATLVACGGDDKGASPAAAPSNTQAAPGQAGPGNTQNPASVAPTPAQPALGELPAAAGATGDLNKLKSLVENAGQVDANALKALQEAAKAAGAMGGDLEDAQKALNKNAAVLKALGAKGMDKMVEGTNQALDALKKGGSIDMKNYKAGVGKQLDALEAMGGNKIGRAHV